MVMLEPIDEVALRMLSWVSWFDLYFYFVDTWTEIRLLSSFKLECPYIKSFCAITIPLWPKF